jgi:hypothetical protein
LKRGVKTAVRSAPITKGSQRSRTIASTEIKEWFESCRKPRPNDELCAEITVQLTKMRWLSDPPENFGLKNYDELLERGLVKLTRQDAESAWIAVVDAGPNDRWWDVQGAAKAANVLTESLPAMLRHLKELRFPTPESRRAYKTVRALAKSLSAARLYIEEPFGEYPRIDPRKQPRPKSWHMPAVGIAHTIIDAIKQTGRHSVSTAANSITVQVVGRALARMGYGHVEASTIARHLDRRAKKGLAL